MYTGYSDCMVIALKHVYQLIRLDEHPGNHSISQYHLTMKHSPLCVRFTDIIHAHMFMYKGVSTIQHPLTFISIPGSQVGGRQHITGLGIHEKGCSARYS